MPPRAPVGPMVAQPLPACHGSPTPPRRAQGAPCLTGARVVRLRPSQAEVEQGMATVDRPRAAGLVGVAVRRPTAPRFLRGAAQFLDDVPLPGLLHAALLRSPHAHARVRTIDVAPALALRGVHAALTAAEVGPRTAPLPAP